MRAELTAPSVCRDRAAGQGRRSGWLSWSDHRSRPQTDRQCQTVGRRDGGYVGLSQQRPHPTHDRPLGQWNRFEITMKGDRLTVVLNGQTVIENAQLPGVPKRGPIALQHHGDPIQFASILIKELE